MDGFMAALQAAAATQGEYTAALPQWVQLWMNWMGIVLALGSLVFTFFKVEARWLLLAFALSIVATFALGMTIGWNGLWGSTHLVFWTPVVIYMYRRLPAINSNSIYGVWYLLALATMIISLVFDAKDVVQYLVA
tara:strand:- start:395 stop:799 length:405 start_codon:yes stop_codon:yes gene_type:complete